MRTAIVGVCGAACMAALCAGCGGLMSLGFGTPLVEEAPAEFAMIGRMKPYALPVHHIAFSPDGEQIVTLAYNFYSRNERVSSLPVPGVLRVWRIRDTLPPIELASLAIEGGGQFAEFTPDAREVVFGTQDGTIFWDIEGRSTTRTLLEPDDERPIPAPDCRLLAVDRDDGVIEIVDSETGEIRSQIDTGSPAARTLRFTPDGRRLLIHRSDAASGALLLDVRDVATGKSVAEFFGSHQLWFGFNFVTPVSPDGRFLLHLQTGTKNTRRLTVLEIETKLPHAVLDQSTGEYWCAAFSPDGRLLATGGEGVNDEKGKFTAWNLRTETAITSIEEESAWGVTALAFSPDGKTLAVGNSDGEVRLRRVPDNRSATGAKR
ncbi:MAG: hypothetical protein WD069_09055 [Planctomycetales bacterium]